jgi:hypothetical protein
MFRSSTIVRELVLSLAKVMLEHYVLIGYVVVWQRVLGVACVLYAVQNESHDMLPHHHITYKDIVF